MMTIIIIKLQLSHQWKTTCVVSNTKLCFIIECLISVTNGADLPTSDTAQTFIQSANMKWQLI